MSCIAVALTPQPASSAAATQGTPTPQNQTLFQAFEWHTPGPHYPRLTGSLSLLADLGVTLLWLPPGCKANDPQGNGYDCYDLWDLGEFDQKWTRATKWGSREQLDELLELSHELKFKVIWDAVLNHKTAGDATEPCWAVEVDGGDRTIETSRPKQIEPWIHYNFPGRGNTYSSLKWHWQHFNGTDWDQRAQRHALYKIIDPPEAAPRPGVDAATAVAAHRPRPKGWADDVDDEQGNADYLMFSNIDYTHPQARDDVLRWGEWMVSHVGVDGFRLDAVQHYSWRFTREWIARVRRARPGAFVVGEFWVYDVAKLVAWIQRVGPDDDDNDDNNNVWAYDAPLLANFSRASLAKGRFDFDLRKIFRDTLVAARPRNAVTVVANHDTQPGQTMATPIAPFFKPLAYALTLLRKGGLPCVFYGDLYGTHGPYAEPPACGGRLPALVLSRKNYAYGEQTDYFDSRTCIGWVRHGTWDRVDGCAVVMSIAGPARKRMFLGQRHAGQVWTDVLDNCSEKIVVDDRGYGVFVCGAKSVSVFVREDAPGRDQFTEQCHADKYRL
ncbi:hypothetical protein MBLNU459_g4575t1 [Dothideomycetes sp. NU459]